MDFITQYSLQLAALCLATVLLAPGSARAQDPDLVISDLQLVSSKRINRTVYEYVYRAVARNRGGAAEAVQATLESWPVQLSVIDGEASFGALAAGQSLPSADTITLRHDRSRGGFTAQGLTWRFSYLQQEPGLLSGAPDLPAVQATTDLRIVGVNPDAPVATDTDGARILRTVLVVTLAPDATVGQVNAALTRHGARINVMLAGAPVLSVTVPDPGSLPALKALAATLRAEPGIKSVDLSYQPVPKALPTNLDYQLEGLLPGRIGIIDHHLAIRGAAVWNLKGMLDKPELRNLRPTLVIADYFGRGWPAAGPIAGMPPEGWSALIPPADIKSLCATCAGDDHGYGVLSVISADHGGTSSDFDLTTGLYPATLKARVVDLEFKDIDSVVHTASVLGEARSTGANVILNTSLGVCETRPEGTCTAEERLRAHRRGQHWLSLVRGNGLENTFLHLTAAGNERAAMAWQTSGFNFVARGLQLPPQDEMDLLDFDADTITEVDESGDPVLDWLFQPIKHARLDNILSVENRYNVIAGTEEEPVAQRRLPPFVGCLSPKSTRGGHIAGIGGATYQEGAATVDSKIWLAQGPTSTFGSGQNTGTSFASPQVAAAAAWVWSLRPDLTALQVRDILLRTTMTTSRRCNHEDGQPPYYEAGAHDSVDVYAATLATDNPHYDNPAQNKNLGATTDAPARLWLLDVASANADGSLSTVPDGKFTQADILKFLQEFEARQGRTDYSRYDLNGNGATGEDFARTDLIEMSRFDLDGNLDWTTANQTMEGLAVAVHEYQPADIGVLIFYAYSPLYTGNEYERALLLAPYLEKFNNKTLFLEGLDIQAGSPARIIRLTSLQKQGDGTAFVSNCATGERGEPLFSAEVYNRSAETQIAPMFWQGLMSNRISDEPPNAPSCSSFVATVPSTGQWWINVAARNRKDTAPVHDNEYQMRVYLGEPDLLAGPSGNLNPPPGRVASQRITYGSAMSSTLDPQGWTIPYTPSPGFPEAFQMKGMSFIPSL